MMVNVMMLRLKKWTMIALQLLTTSIRTGKIVVLQR
jgi:hypothetical protein